MKVREIAEGITARVWDDGAVAIDYRPRPEAYLSRIHLTSDQFQRLVRFYNGAHPVAGTVGSTMAETYNRVETELNQQYYGRATSAKTDWNFPCVGHGRLLP